MVSASLLLQPSSPLSLPGELSLDLPEQQVGHETFVTLHFMISGNSNLKSELKILTGHGHSHGHSYGHSHGHSYGHSHVHSYSPFHDHSQENSHTRTTLEITLWQPSWSLPWPLSWSLS